MADPIPAIAIVGAGVVALLFVLVIVGRSTGTKRKKGRLPTRDRGAFIREANRRLAQNPKDTTTLKTLADLYFEEEAWDKAMSSYGVLLDHTAIDSSLDEFEVTFRYAVAAMKLRAFDEAHKGFVLARAQEPDVFEVNFNLGYLEFRRKNYEKAAALLRGALTKQPDHLQTQKYLGHSLFKLGRHKEAIRCLKQVLDQEPDDRESLFTLGQCFFELGMNDQAVKIFSHLRPDPSVGPQAALLVGTIHLKLRQYDKAVMDFEIGLRHKEIKQDVLLELKYRLASAYAKQQDIAQALTHLTQIRDMARGYKDVEGQIARFRELNSNKNLQVYLLAPTSDFVSLCRKLVTNFIPQSKVKILDISVQRTDFCDLLAETETSRWQDIILYRFIRTNGQVGELMLRDFHSRLKETKSGRGYCISAGEFSESAKKFVEARLIDLIDKDGLVKRLPNA